MKPPICKVCDKAHWWYETHQVRTLEPGYVHERLFPKTHEPLTGMSDDDNTQCKKKL